MLQNLLERVSEGVPSLNHNLRPSIVTTPIGSRIPCYLGHSRLSEVETVAGAMANAYAGYEDACQVICVC